MGKGSRVYAIIQARYGSNRFPRKIGVWIEGEPMLGRVIERVRKGISDIIVATPDPEIAEYAERLGVLSYIGSEDDVLNRYYQASVKYNVSDIVRLTADNPLLDPNVLCQVVNFYLENNFDYVSNNLKRSYPLGLDVEVFSFNALEKAWKRATLQPDREHVTPYIRNHPELFRLGNVENDINLSHLRWTVDYQEDLDFVRNIYSNLGGNFTMNDVLEYTKKGVET